MKPLRILLIEDDLASLSKIEAVLVGARYQVSSCASFQVASRLLKTMKGKAIVVCALEVDEASGLDFLEQALKSYAFLPVILFSSRPTVEDVTKALRAGAHDYLKKPVSAVSLLESVARANHRMNLTVEADALEKESRSQLAAMRAELKSIQSHCAFKGFMISMAAHDFRSVLTVLDGYQQIILQNCDNSCHKEIPLRMREQTSRTIFRLQSMASMLFDVEAAEKGELRIQAVPFDYDALLRECATFYRPYAAQKRVDLDVDSRLPSMRAIGDPARVLQIFDNILYNAVKFTPAEGVVRIGGGAVEAGFVTATIRDTGSGLPTAMIKEILGDAPMTTKKDEHARLGMGLTICRRLVASQNGRFGLVSQPGEGTTVSISLPAAD